MGCDPIGMAAIAMDAAMLKELAQYVSPKRWMGCVAEQRHAPAAPMMNRITEVFP